MQKRLGHTADRISPATFRRERVSSLGRREPVRVGPSTPLAAALVAMQNSDARSVLVTDPDDRLVGIFTERDVVVRVLAANPAADTNHPISEYMTQHPDALRLESTLGEALSLMEAKGYHGVPLVDDGGRVAGHLDARDVLEYIAEAFPQEILNLPPRPHQQAEEAEGA